MGFRSKKWEWTGWMDRLDTPYALMTSKAPAVLTNWIKRWPKVTYLFPNVPREGGGPPV